MKWQLLTLMRACLPLRDVFAGLMRETHDLVQPETRLFLRDCHDHATRIIEEAETYRDIDTSLMALPLQRQQQDERDYEGPDRHLGHLHPPTFVVGVYGMNFDPQRSPFNMPELEWKYGYPFAWGLMLAIAGGMVVMFKRRGWLGRIDEDPTEAGGEQSAGCRSTTSIPIVLERSRAQVDVPALLVAGDDAAGGLQLIEGGHLRAGLRRDDHAVARRLRRHGRLAFGVEGAADLGERGRGRAGLGLACC